MRAAVVAGVWVSCERWFITAVGVWVSGNVQTRKEEAYQCRSLLKILHITIWPSSGQPQFNFGTM